jgi:GWxTD domain-containing protein
LNELEIWIQSAGAQAPGWPLFHFLWEGAAIAGLPVVALAFLNPAAALFTVERRHLARSIGRLPWWPSALRLVSTAVALAAWQPAPALAEPAPQEPVRVQMTAPPQGGAVGVATVPLVGEAPVRADDLDQWVGDTVYVSTPEERRIYQGLRSDPDRRKFIEQFWARHNPPGAAANTFRDEYYRRLTTARAKYSMTAGDQTMLSVMGGAYMRFGPPDQIEDHLSDPRNPSQIWRYDHLEAFHSNVEFQFAVVGRSFRQHINWPPPMATFEGVEGVAGSLPETFIRESQLRGEPVAKSVTPGFPGGHASMRLYPVKDLTTLSIPLGSLSGRADMVVEIRPRPEASTAGQVVANVRDYVQVTAGGTWETTFALGPGSYVCRTIVKEAAGQLYGETINFTVSP